MTQTTEPARHFRGCPECGKDDGYLNVGRCHWFICDEHRVKWCVGFNLFSSWREETEAEQREQWKRIEGYKDATIYPPEVPPLKFIKTEIALGDDGKTQSPNIIRAGPIDVNVPQGTDLRRGSTKEPRDDRPTLAEVGIDKKLSSRAQKLAAIPKAKREKVIAEGRERIQKETDRVTSTLQRTSWLLRHLANEMAEQCSRRGENIFGFGCEAAIQAENEERPI